MKGLNGGNLKNHMGLFQFSVGGVELEWIDSLCLIFTEIDKPLLRTCLTMCDQNVLH